MRADLVPIVVGTDGLYLDMSRLNGHGPVVVDFDLGEMARPTATETPNLAPRRAWPPWASAESGAPCPDRIFDNGAPWYDGDLRDEGDLVDNADHLFGASLFGSREKVERAMRHAEKVEESYGAVVSVLRDLFSVFEGCTVDLGIDGDGPPGTRRMMISMPPNLGAGFAAMLLDARVGGGVDLCRLKLPLTRPYAQWYGVYFEPELHVFVDPRDVRAHRWHLSRWQEGRHGGLEFKLDSVLHAYQPGTYFDPQRVNHYGRGTGCFVFPTDDGWSQEEYDAATCRVEMAESVGAVPNL